MFTTTAPCSRSGGSASNGWQEGSVSSFYISFYNLGTCVDIKDLFFLRSLLWCSHECGDSHPDVPVLRPGLLRTQDPEVPVVEEVPDHHSDGEIWLDLVCRCSHLVLVQI